MIPTTENTKRTVLMLFDNIIGSRIIKTPVTIIIIKIHLSTNRFGFLNFKRKARLPVKIKQRPKIPTQIKMDFHYLVKEQLALL